MSLSVKFNPSNSTIRLNGRLVSLHCHHYNCGLLKTIEELPGMDGRSIFIETVAEEFYKPFRDRLADDLAGFSVHELLQEAEEAYRFMGFGRLDLGNLTKDGGVVYADSSYYVVGWLAKYGRRFTPVCHFTCGYIKAILAAIFDVRPDVYDVTEEEW